MDAEREVKSDYPESYCYPYTAIFFNLNAYAVVSGRHEHARRLGTGLTEDQAWEDARMVICFERRGDDTEDRP